MKTLYVGTIAATALFMTGCVGSGHQMPKVDQAHLSSVKYEIRNNQSPEKRYISNAEGERKVKEIYSKLRPTARAICQSGGMKKCYWNVKYSDNQEINAYAHGNNNVVIQKGILEYAKNDDEIALVIAHELSHHMANHINEKKQNAVVGALVMGAIGAYAAQGYYNPYSYGYNPSAGNELINTSVQLGATVGQLTFSKTQEKEADYLAAYIVKQSGYSLDNARGMLMTLAVKSGRTKSGLFSTHPAGPERLSAWDATVREISTNSTNKPIIKKYDDVLEDDVF